jgi:hypothetical protein
VRQRKLAQVTFVIDEDTGPSAAEGIREAGGHAVLLTHARGMGAKDVDWLPTVKQLGHALITRDISMRFDHKDVFAACGVHVFIVRAAGIRIDELRVLMRSHHATMCRFVRTHALPFVARVTRNDVVVIDSPGRRGAIKR